ncbi:MAG: SGNH/GDSL hydrolase family protein [Planctomycetota bacterium]
MWILGLGCLMACAQSAGSTSDNANFRGKLDNSRLKFTTEKKGHVAFMGGSITEMEGYRPIMMESLKRRFPSTDFSFTNAGISSTCSTTGAFRLAEDVLSKGPVDLFFLEFAVNDDQDAHHGKKECIRGMEGIIRHLRVHNPSCDIVMVHFVNEAMLASLAKGKEPLSSGSHEDVAVRHEISSAHVARELASRIKDGSLTWARYGGVHPARPGNELAASVVNRILDKGWSGPLAESIKAHPQAELLDKESYVRGRFLDSSQWVRDAAWRLSVPDWKSIKGDCRPRFRNMPLFNTDLPAAEFSVSFEGNCLAAYLLAGPDAGIAEVSIDGGPFKPIQLKHAYSKGLHYPRTVMLATDLPQGTHKAAIRKARNDNPEEKTAIRIIRLGSNQ